MRWFGKRETVQPAEQLDGVCYCSDEQLVQWPGYYRTLRLSDGSMVPDRARRAVWVDDPTSDLGGHYEDA